MITFFPILVGTQSSGTAGSGPQGDRDILSVQESLPIVVESGTPFEELNLPSSREVTLSDGSKAIALILWSGEGYDGDTIGEYELEGEIINPPNVTNSQEIIATIDVTVVASVVYDYYVKTPANGGNDGNNGLSPSTSFATPERAIQEAQTAGGIKSIFLDTGEYVVSNYLTIPNQISLYGAGIDLTVIKGNASLNHTFISPNYAIDKFLITIPSTSGNLNIRDLTIEGNARAMHGGILCQGDNVTLRDVRIANFGFMGLWVDGTQTFRYLSGQIINSAFGSTNFYTGALSLGTNTNTEINDVFVNVNEGYAIKSLRPNNAVPTHTGLVIRDSYSSVAPTSNFGSGNIPNLCIDFRNSILTGCLIERSQTDNTLVFTRPAGTNPTGITTLRITNHFFDQLDRADGGGHPLQLSLHNVRIDRSYFLAGSEAAIANFDTSGIAADGWDINHNVFKDQQGLTPTGIVRSTNCPLKNVNFFNNLVYASPTQTRTIAVFYTSNGVVSQNVKCTNNIIWIRSTSFPSIGEGGPSSLIRLDGGGGITGFECTYNIVNGIPIDNLPGGVFNNNITNPPPT